MEKVDLVRPTYDGLMLLYQHFVTLIPQLIAGLVMLVGGLIASLIIRKVIQHGLQKAKFDHLIERVGLSQWLIQFSIQPTPSRLMGSLAGIFTFMVFALAAVDSLGLSGVSQLLDTFILFLPKLVAGILILIIGCFIAQAIFSGVKTATTKMGIDYGRSVAEVVRGMVIIVSLSLSISQLDIDVSLLNWMIGVVCASVGLGAAISIGIGTRSLTQEIISGVYLRDMYSVGDKLTIGDTSGKLAQIGAVAVRLADDDGHLITISNTQMLRRQVIKSSDPDC